MICGQRSEEKDMEKGFNSVGQVPWFIVDVRLLLRVDTQT